ncbi:hypothetical protein CLV24_102410 [Pontibacter ummariensis]|uniref:Uncharacterized protein n=1 Tax=Pontibacter ummariensis TaxID=1610492 RepID=A0A239BK00_9BACT|nr:hypothetical protein CLV24_102410 [Pontibacter ummariensis]SNS08475.1 hypothetical protein SAMN06296052_1022 [Pontibacter ummariensis]
MAQDFKMNLSAKACNPSPCMAYPVYPTNPVNPDSDEGERPYSKERLIFASGHHGMSDET